MRQSYLLYLLIDQPKNQRCANSYNKNNNHKMQSNCRYDKLNTFLHLQHQHSHYKRIYESKKCINFQDAEYNKVYRLSSNPKYQKVKQQQRKENNFKLVKRINQINHSDGILESMKKQSTQPKKILYNRTGRSAQAQEERIHKDNIRIASRLQEAKPKIGTISQWKAHFKKFKTLQKRIHKDNRYDNEQQLRSTIFSISRSKRRQVLLLTDLTRKDPKSIISRSSSQMNESKLRSLENQIISIPKINKPNKTGRLKTNEDRKNLSADFTLPKWQGQKFKMQVNNIVRTEKSEEKTEKKV